MGKHVGCCMSRCEMGLRSCTLLKLQARLGKQGHLSRLPPGCPETSVIYGFVIDAWFITRSHRRTMCYEVMFSRVDRPTKSTHTSRTFCTVRCSMLLVFEDAPTEQDTAARKWLSHVCSQPAFFQIKTL